MAYIFLAVDFPPKVGGIQSYHKHLAQALWELGREVHVIAVSQPGDGVFDEAYPCPVTRVSTQGGKLGILRRMRQAAVETAKTLHRPLRGIVATKWFPEGPAADDVASQLDVPWGVFGHDREFVLHGINLAKWVVQQHVFRKTDICFAISNYAAWNFRTRGVSERKIRMVGCGVEADRFQPDTAGAAVLRERHGIADRKVIATVSRVVRRKGHLTVIEALPEIQRLTGPVVYLVVGGGEYTETVRAAAQRCGVADSVVFTGEVATGELCGYYTLADVMVMPSLEIRGEPTEGFGLVFLEANCCSTPVIGSRTGGIPDAVDHGISGLLVPQNSPRELARAAVRLLVDTDYATRLGKQGHERAVHQFQWNWVAGRVDACFNELNPAPGE